jgi:pyruvate/2-oxoglutarate dehydrogenase complex dihydrolipoamide dehydrogenase (E3) component
VFVDYLNGGGRKIRDRKPIHALYMDPPLARVGVSEEEAKRSNKSLLVARYQMASVSRAREKGETEGLIKIIVEEDTDLIVGATVFGVGGDEVIGMLALAMQSSLEYGRIQDTVLPHPTVSELVPWVFNSLEPLPRG